MDPITLELPTIRAVKWGLTPSEVAPDQQEGFVDIMVGDQGPIRVYMTLERYQQGFLPQVEG